MKETKRIENEERRQTERRTKARKRFIGEAPPRRNSILSGFFSFSLVEADFFFLCDRWLSSIPTYSLTKFYTYLVRTTVLCLPQQLYFSTFVLIRKTILNYEKPLFFGRLQDAHSSRKNLSSAPDSCERPGNRTPPYPVSLTLHVSSLNYPEQLVSTLEGETCPKPPYRSLHPGMLEKRTGIFFGENNPKILKNIF